MGFSFFWWYSGNALTTTLNGGIDASTTTIVLTSAVNFPSTGTNHISIDNEDISYTGISGKHINRRDASREAQQQHHILMVQQLQIL